MIPRKKDKKRSWKWLAISAGIVILLAGSIFLFGLNWAMRWARSDSLRQTLESTLSEIFQGKAKLEQVNWQEKGLHSDSLDIEADGKNGYERLSAEGIRAEFDSGAIWKGIWRIPGVQVDRLEVALSRELPDTDPGKNPVPVQPPDAGEKAPSSFWESFLPDRHELGPILVQEVHLTGTLGEETFQLEGTQIRIEQALSDQAWIVEGKGGTLIFSEDSGEYKVRNLILRVQPGMIYLNDLTLEHPKGGVIIARGEASTQSNGKYRLDVRVDGVDVKSLMEETYHEKVRGKVHALLKVTGVFGNTSQMKVEGKGNMTDASLENLPVLLEIAKYTGVERFKNLRLDHVNADFTYQNQEVNIHSLILQSNGLTRAEGDFEIRRGEIEGSLDLGVTPEALQRIPGAEQRVFTKSEPSKSRVGEQKDRSKGFVWTTVRLQGPLGSPSEDLTSRLVRAAGTAILVDKPLEMTESTVQALIEATQGSDLVPAEATKPAQEFLNQSMDLLKQGGEGGIDLLTPLIEGLAPKK